MNIYPVITLYQPWATWIMREWKTIETRTHARFSCLNKKEILIHAGQTTDNSLAAVSNPYLTTNQIMQDPYDMINGFILGSVYITDFGKLTEQHSKASLIDCDSVDRFGLFLGGINKFEYPIPCKGEMGIWYFDMDAMQKVKKPAAQSLTLF